MSQPTWITAADLGEYPSLKLIDSIPLSANPILPATEVSYAMISGELPAGLSLVKDSILGTPSLVDNETKKTFVVRATDNLGNIRDRTFTITITGNAVPSFTSQEGNILYTLDSVWIDYPIRFDNPDQQNLIYMEIVDGSLPAGLTLTPTGNIRGYASAPILGTTYSSISTSVFSTNDTSANTLNSLSTSGFATNRPLRFEGNMFGGLANNTTYYVKGIETITDFSISKSVNGNAMQLSDGEGLITATLLDTVVKYPVVETYNFIVELNSPLGKDRGNFSITVENWVLNNAPNSRIPTILNTKPLSFNVPTLDEYTGYYLQVDNTERGNIGRIQSGDYFTFKVIGYDFDGSELKYQFDKLPTWLTGNVSTGWLTGIPDIESNSVQEFSFSANVAKFNNTSIVSSNTTFYLIVENNISNEIDWITNSNLGNILYGTLSYFSVKAVADVDLKYSLVSGSLPPNLTLEENGEITGKVSFQPMLEFLKQNANISFTFTVKAESTEFDIISSTKEFTLTVLQKNNIPTDILYVKATPSISDRVFIDTLLTDEIIPPNLIYRPDDIFFGKASGVIYEHAFGIHASDIQTYLIGASKNHYWRNITLGEIKTAVAKNDNNEVVYEVVYSEVIDNLVNLTGKSVSSELNWPRPINLNFGPWYTSRTDIFTSFIFGEDVLYSEKKYYTSLSPGQTSKLHPNSLYNMRKNVAKEAGQEYDSKLLPLWMTSQQSNGSTLGFTPAWVICYLKPTKNSSSSGITNAAQIKYNIENKWVDTMGNRLRLNSINFQLDRFSVNKSATYNYDTLFKPPAWAQLPGAQPQPDPIDKKDFYVLVPRKTILPDGTSQ